MFGTGVALKNLPPGAFKAKATTENRSPLRVARHRRGPEEAAVRDARRLGKRDLGREACDRRGRRPDEAALTRSQRETLEGLPGLTQGPQAQSLREEGGRRGPGVH